MKLYIDLDTLTLIAGPSDRRIVSQIQAKRGDNLPVEVQFLRSGQPVRLAASTVLTFGAKPLNQFDADPVVLDNTFAQSAAPTDPEETDNPVWTASPSLNTVDLNDLFLIDGDPSNDPQFVDMSAEFTWMAAGDDGPTTIRTVVLRVLNDVVRGDEGTPITLPTPSDWLDARAVRYDKSQDLTPEEEAQARQNIRSGPGGPARVFTAADIVESNGLDALYIPPNENVMLTDATPAHDLVEITDWAGSTWQGGETTYFLNQSSSDYALGALTVPSGKTAVIYYNGITPDIFLLGAAGPDGALTQRVDALEDTLGAEAASLTEVVGTSHELRVTASTPGEAGNSLTASLAIGDSGSARFEAAAAVRTGSNIAITVGYAREMVLTTPNPYKFEIGMDIWILFAFGPIRLTYAGMANGHPAYQALVRILEDVQNGQEMENLLLRLEHAYDESEDANLYQLRLYDGETTSDPLLFHLIADQATPPDGDPSQISDWAPRLALSGGPLTVTRSTGPLGEIASQIATSAAGAIITAIPSGSTQPIVTGFAATNLAGGEDAGDVTLKTLTLQDDVTFAPDTTFVYGNTTAQNNHLTALGGGAAGQEVFKAATPTEVIRQLRRKFVVPTDVELTQTAPNSIPIFTVPVVAGVDYYIMAKIEVKSTANTAGWRFQLSCPDVDAVQASGHGLGVNAMTSSAPGVPGMLNLGRSDFLNYSGNAAYRTIDLFWHLRFADSGNFTINASQSTADANNPTTVYAKSWLSIEDV
jgi:hypothetical protein